MQHKTTRHVLIIIRQQFQLLFIRLKMEKPLIIIYLDYNTFGKSITE